MADLETLTFKDELKILDNKEQKIRDANKNFRERLNNPLGLSNFPVISDLLSIVAETVVTVSGEMGRPITAAPTNMQPLIPYLDDPENPQSQPATQMPLEKPRIDHSSVILKIILCSLIVIPTTILVYTKILSPGYILLGLGGVGIIFAFEVLKDLLLSFLGKNEQPKPNDTEEFTIKNEFEWIRNRLYGAYLFMQTFPSISEEEAKAYRANETSKNIYDPAVGILETCRTDVFNHLDPLIISAINKIWLRRKTIAKCIAESGKPTPTKQ